MIGNTYALTFMFRLGGKEDQALAELVEKGGGKHILNIVSMRIDMGHTGPSNAPHQMLKDLALSDDDALVHSDITITPVKED